MKEYKWGMDHMDSLKLCKQRDKKLVYFRWKTVKK